MKEYFELQFTMINRKLKDEGLNIVIVYVLLIASFVGLSIRIFHEGDFSPYVYILSALTLIGFLSESKRTEFLTICFGDFKAKKIRISENLICSIPFLSFLLFKQLFLSAGLLLILAAIIALVNFRTSFNFTMWSPFSKRPFEFTAGFRSTFFIFMAAYILIIIAVHVNNFMLGAFALSLVFFATWFYYSILEHEFWIWTYNQTPKQFLWGKIKIALWYSSWIAMPMVMTLCVFYFQYIEFVFLIVLIGWMILIFIILSKYGSYPRDMRLLQAILFAFCVILPPLLFVLIPYFYKRSTNRLSSILK